MTQVHMSFTITKIIVTKLLKKKKEKIKKMLTRSES